MLKWKFSKDIKIEITAIFVLFISEEMFQKNWASEIGNQETNMPLL